MRVAIAVLILVPAIASAGDESQSPRSPDAQRTFETDCAYARKHNKVCVLRFEPEAPPIPPPVVESRIISWRPPPLIQVPRDFIAEILASAEEL
jgi:hypothetical protein